MKKHLAFLLAVLMLLAALFTMAACQTDGPTPDNNPDTDPDVDGGVTPPNPSPVTTPIDYLPSEKYGTEEEPAQYNILNWTCGNSTETGTTWIPWEEADVAKVDGDILGEAVFNRNASVEARYGIEITSEYGCFGGTPDYTTLITSDTQNGEGRYQLCISRAYHLLTLLRNDFLYDMNLQEKYLHTDEPWWVEDSVASYSLGNHLYAACTEMLLRDKGATATLWYNKELAKDHEEDLPDFYQLVKNHEWTMDQMIEACDLVCADVGGEEGMLDSYEDIYGLVSNSDPMYYFYNAFGHKWAHINEDGYVEYEFNQSEENGSLLAMQDLLEDILYADWYFNENFRTDVPEGKDVFCDGHALFRSGMLKHPVTRLKNMKTEYGILPHPMYNELQADYSSLVWEHHDSFLGIPTGAAATTGAEYSAVILEMLSWESYYSVSPVFYEEILFARAAKDTPDKEMIQEILRTRSYDPGLYYDNKSGLPDGIGALITTKSSDVASVYQQYGDIAIGNMEKINHLIDGEDYE